MSQIIFTIFSTLICLTVICCTSRMTGGWSDLATNDTSVQNVTHFAVEMFNKQSNDIHIKQLVTIKSAKSQVVSGRKFNITFTVADTDCSKNGVQRNNINECPPKSTSSIETCNAIIWQRVWLNSTQLLDIKCCPSDRTDC